MLQDNYTVIGEALVKDDGYWQERLAALFLITDDGVQIPMPGRCGEL